MEDEDKTTEQLVQEFLERGGAITQIPLGQRTESADPKNYWGGRPKKKPTAEDPFPGKPKKKK